MDSLDMPWWTGLLVFVILVVVRILWRLRHRASQAEHDSERYLGRGRVVIDMNALAGGLRLDKHGRDWRGRKRVGRSYR